MYYWYIQLSTHVFLVYSSKYTCIFFVDSSEYTCIIGIFNWVHIFFLYIQVSTHVLFCIFKWAHMYFFIYSSAYVMVYFKLNYLQWDAIVRFVGGFVDHHSFNFLFTIQTALIFDVIFFSFRYKFQSKRHKTKGTFIEIIRTKNLNYRD